MSLMRWLAACRSLKSVDDRPSPYRMTQQNLLPRFGPRAAGQGGVAKRVLAWLWEWIGEPWRPVVQKLCSLCRPPRILTRTRKRAKTPIQAELVLDTVRVIRNDLTDEDLVPEKKRGPSWGRMTSRIFGTSESVR
jgi:hypothetical protein